ncbi:MAG: PQQ-binding-like beta-propeller repeat protein [Candidatus Sumerlaeia bacterium]|nr:PQQ-binding-like beta-propeller repeat protein [Candidatus Sumerlaeia bacterium]
MWRYDANRSAASPAELPDQLHPQWALTLPPLEPAWPEQMNESRMTFDHAYSPIVLGKTMFVGSSRDDSLRAYDTETASEKWRFYADAPIRFAPAAWNGKVYVVSDDGMLYCLRADDGTVVWKYRGGPSARKVLGNKRLVSTWLARGGPVVADGKVYFAAGIWPFMGVFIYCLDAETGKRVWLNDGSGSIYMQSPHSGAFAFNAVAPQGYLVVVGNTLLVPNGRAAAAGFDRRTGELLYFRFAEHGKNGTCHTAAVGEVFNNSNKLCSVSDGKPMADLRDGAILTETIVYTAGDGRIQALTLGKKLSRRWSYSARQTELFCKAGSRLYAGGPDRVVALEDLGDSYTVRWESAIHGTPAQMLAADNKLFVVTREGRIYCFGEREGPTVLRGKPLAPPTWPAQDDWTEKVRAILSSTNVQDGYCLVLGVGSGRLMEELARLSNLNVIGLDPDGQKVEQLRRRWDDKIGIARERLSILQGDIYTAQLPPYLASLILTEDPEASGIQQGVQFVEKIFHSLRPYGGKVCFPAETEVLFRKAAGGGQLANAQIARAGDFALLERAGALPGAADWTHQYGDPANTGVSKDKLVKAPLGLLWFGGSSNNAMLPRHRHGPPEQVVGGRMFIEGQDLMRAVDVYTGRILWETHLPGIGHNFVKFPITAENEKHEPGANHMGSNFAVTTDGVYVCHGPACLRLDPATGQVRSTFALAGEETCSQVRVYGDLLVLAFDPLLLDFQPLGENNWNGASSRRLVVMNRHSGEVLWQRSARHAFHHNTIIVGNNTVFCIDRLPPGQEAKLKRRGRKPASVGAQYCLLALDVHTGEQIWSTTETVFGTWLGYSQEHDILLQGARQSADMVRGEPGGRLIAYRGRDGSVLWDKREDVDQGPYLIHNDVLYMQQGNYKPMGALYLRTGETYMREHPLTGETVPWQFIRNKGCGTAIACENLLTFRSGAAAFYDLTTNGGVGNLGGFRSGCTSNLIAANGVLNAPDYTLSCVCSYQNQTSVAMIYTPDVEVWTWGAVESSEGPIRRAGINFGAPGDRIADNGTLWMEYPVPDFGDKVEKGLTFPNLDIRVEPESPKWFRRHSSWFPGDPMAWVTASGAVGLTKITIPLGNSAPCAYRVRLFFAEPDGIAPGQRRFDVALQGREVLTDFDIARTAGLNGRSVVKEFSGILAEESLIVSLTPDDDAPIREPVICGIEIVAE